MPSPPRPRSAPNAADYRRRRILAVVAVVATAAAVGVVLARGGGGGDPAVPAPIEADTAAPPPGRDTRAAFEPSSPQEAAAGKPVSTADWKPSRDPVPMLMYHDIAQAPADAPFPELHTSPRDFKAQMDWLDEEGYTAVTMAQVTDAWDGDGELPPKPIVVSLDDGFASHRSDAMPILGKHGWPGVLNLQAFSGKGLPESAPISPAEVEDLLDAGWELGAHSITHSDLTTVDAAQLEDEVALTKKALESQFGVTIDHFCYPAGRYDDAVVAEVKRAGYRTASSTEPGLASPDEPYDLNRIRIDASDGLDGFAQKVQAAGT
jgi:peptidoglycan/xylan/chitin deacetylase (PgdA/CDA1 family)